MERTLPEPTLAAITSRDLDKARARAQALLGTVPPVVPLGEAVARSDLIVKATPASAFREIATAVLETAGWTPSPRPRWDRSRRS